MGHSIDLMWIICSHEVQIILIAYVFETITFLFLSYSLLIITPLQALPYIRVSSLLSCLCHPSQLLRHRLSVIADNVKDGRKNQFEKAVKVLIIVLGLQNCIVEYPVPVSQEDLFIQAMFPFHTDSYGYATASCLVTCPEALFFEDSKSCFSWKFRDE